MEYLSWCVQCKTTCDSPDRHSFSAVTKNELAVLITAWCFPTCIWWASANTIKRSYIT